MQPDRNHLRAGKKMSGAANTVREFLSVAEVIEKLGVGRTLVYRLMASGEIKSVRIGCRRMIPAAAYAEYTSRLKGEAA